MIKAILYRDWDMVCGLTGERATVAKGTHELERVPNPRGYDAPWLVLKGTKTGMAEGAWRQWIPVEEGAWHDGWDITIEEDGVPLEPMEKPQD